MDETPPVDVVLHPGPLGAAADWRSDGAGAVVVFEGIVRPTEDGRALDGLDYEQYDPMTRAALDSLGRDLIGEHRLLGLRVEHSVGHVPNHAVSFRLYIASAHRKPALTAMDTFIDRMKAEVPLWKVPVWAEASDGASADREASRG